MKEILLIHHHVGQLLPAMWCFGHRLYLFLKMTKISHSKFVFNFLFFETTYFLETFPSRESISSLNIYYLHILTWLLQMIFFLTSTNYFSWKSHMEDVLRSKLLYRITLGKDQVPIDTKKKPNRIIRMMKHVD
jgi:hypothetical protein